ncbi:MlaC/ttg2D family ABC transporter substrate-binding protein [Desulfopila aestuarii]|uniref:Phospholipid transport system substrate-binding protein n=1 Tax=Desulfopila aestuarii DSM 18488 TaxID=1121416 RepID=A0A1M7YEG1_9BACT|nr:ABC transporter substrate-binding protein [Desulfopila aestuarii]SHO51032.1 phospholipid transport system substrate-binding protein [Desulfopila aestuarii DSM 18488]
MYTINGFRAIVLVLLIVFSPLEGLADSGPMAQLRPTLAKLTAVLSDPSLKGDEHKVERRAKIMSSIKEGFDFREMSRRILGSTWNSISAQEQDQFTELMTKLLENVYIGKLENYSGQTIGYVGERVKGDRAQVSTLVEDNNMQIPVHYIMAMGQGRWMVYDINIEGVSLVRNYMEQFKSILRTEKFEGLIKVIEDKNKSFAEGKAQG